MNLKKAKKLLSMVVYLMILLVTLAILLSMRELIYVCIVVAAVYVALYMKLWRCPHCGTLLDRSGKTYCPSCEKDLDIKLRIP